MAEVGPAQLLGPEWAIFGVWTRLGSTHIDYIFLFSDNGSIWTLLYCLEFLVGGWGVGGRADGWVMDWYFK